MDIKDFNKVFAERMKEVQEFVGSDDVKDILGVEAVNHFKESFTNEGFTDSSLEKWQDVKRRDANSSWYGHSGQTGKVSESRKVAKILTGETEELQGSISYSRIDDGARIVNSTEYAAVHQFGGLAYVYGKKAFQMVARPFMGPSVVLKGNIERKIINRLKQILSK